MERILDHLRQQREQHLEIFRAYLRLPSISSDPAQADQVAACGAYTAQLLREMGMEQVQLLPTGGPPVVTGGWFGAPGKPTVLIYGHYDVQPVDPLEAWEYPPFEPHIKNERMVARGSADDKGQVLMHILAVGACLQVSGRLPVNVRFLIEGEEEIGSPHLPEFLRQHQELLAADVAVVSDSFMWAEGMPAITASLRGLALIEVEARGPNRDLHSGSYGGVVANPVEILARLLARMKDDDGRILIPGFFDGVAEPAPEIAAQLAEIPFDREAYLKDLEVESDWGDPTRPMLERLWLRPTVEINGMWGGFTGAGSKTVLPARAFAKLSMRLVAGQDPDRIASLVGNFLRDQAPSSVEVTWRRLPGGGRAVAVPTDTQPMRAARRALAEAFGREPLIIREGASIPIVSDFRAILGLDTLLLGFALPDARTHSPNETFHLPTFFTGTEGVVRFFHHLGDV